MREIRKSLQNISRSEGTKLSNDNFGIDIFMISNYSDVFRNHQSSKKAVKSAIAWITGADEDGFILTVTF